MNYATTAAKTAAILAKSGTTMSLRVTTPGTYDPATGSETGATTADYATVGVLTNPYVSQRDSYFDGTLIQSGDKVVDMAANVASRPKPGDSVIIASAVWLVVGVVAVEPAGIPVLYKVHVRRG